MFDFVCIGDATRDLFLFLKEAPKFDGQKHPVDDIAWSLGGNAANVSVGLTRLGLNTALVTIFGDDDRGAWIKKELLKNNVDLGNSATEPGRQSNLSTVTVFAGNRTIFSYHSSGAKQIENFPPCRWVYLTGAPGRDSGALFDLVAQNHNNFKLAFNPAMTDLKKGRDFLRPILEATEVLIMNKEEAAVLGEHGPQVTVITDGPAGAAVYQGEKTIAQPALPAKVVEPTGAGDAFSSGFLAATFLGKDLETALTWGLRNSQSVIQKTGATAGLLTREQVVN
ncbi:MAG: carbohydrate kinase family protein [Patescibacteria group bacterium]|nr:carbohydrate kinase family protein [Patescibacteria group bacterium]MCL5431939.1 carbohydrate kinase family protein [Patescibacteria group bacterium]